MLVHLNEPPSETFTTYFFLNVLFISFILYLVEQDNKGFSYFSG